MANYGHLAPEIRALRKEGLGHREIGRRLGVSEHTSRRWSNEPTSSPRPRVKCVGCGRPQDNRSANPPMCRICTDGVLIPAPPVLEALNYILSCRGEGYGLQDLERDSGVRMRGFYDMISGRKNQVSFNVVDELLTKTGNHLMWFEEPLAPFYHEPKHKRIFHAKHFCKCGKQIKPGRKQCMGCVKANVPRCGVCNKQLARRRAKHCRPCADKLREAGREAWNKKAKRHFVKKA